MAMVCKIRNAKKILTFLREHFIVHEKGGHVLQKEDVW